MLSTTAMLAFAGAAMAKICINGTVPITIQSRNAVFGNVQVPTSQYEVTAFAQSLAKQGVNATAQALTGYADVNGTYMISTQFCRPDNMNGTKPIVQVLTHGIGFDKTYWDLSYDNYTYSYVNDATDKYGYCTLSYDRLGIGMSSHGEVLDEIQINLEVEALYALTVLLRNGTFPQVNHTFSDVLHVGHSFGSAITYTMVNKYTNISDGIALTGFSSNSSFFSQFIQGANFAAAKDNQPLRFGNVTLKQIQETLFMDSYQPLFNYIAGIDSLPPSQMLPDGYLVASNAPAIQSLFFLPGYFDYKGLLPLTDKTKQPVTVGELLTVGSIPMNNSYAGPVLVLTGDADTPFCGGNCLATGNPNISSIPATVRESFPSVPNSKYLTYIQPNTGHAINFHNNATGAYRVINSFFNVTGHPATPSMSGTPASQVSGMPASEVSGAASLSKRVLQRRSGQYKEKYVPRSDVDRLTDVLAALKAARK